MKENRTVYTKDIYNYIDSFAPFSSQAQWDNSGLLVGSFNNEVKRVLIALDITAFEIEKAKEIDAQLIVSHHPVIFSAQKSFLDTSVAFEAARAGISLLCAHTNLDKAVGGVNDTLCEKIGLNYEKMPPDIADGFLNVGTTDIEYTPKEYAKLLSEKLGAAVRFSACADKIKKVAVCSGAGADFFESAKELGCDALVTGDASYHDFLDAEQSGISVFAAGHFETEVIIVEKLQKILAEKFKETEFVVSDRPNPILTEK
ncbi:MAG: Nif3-like dinuclear metal center hexameric protein [Clostridia bacterium]|nr:Nif3-like dinuclear metal center hexameric protein [Clostridia bacterium]